MLKFGLEIALGMIQKSDAAIFENLIFRDFLGGQSPNFWPGPPPYTLNKGDYCRKIAKASNDKHMLF